MKRLAAVGAAGVDRALSGPVVHTGAGAAPAGKVAEKRGAPKPGGLLYLEPCGLIESIPIYWTCLEI
jgi:hypothetical protein